MRPQHGIGARGAARFTSHTIGLDIEDGAVAKERGARLF
jgi:hypothetical protein